MYANSHNNDDKGTDLAIIECDFFTDAFYIYSNFSTGYATMFVDELGVCFLSEDGTIDTVFYINDVICNRLGEKISNATIHRLAKDSANPQFGFSYARLREENLYNPYRRTNFSLLSYYSVPIYEHGSNSFTLYAIAYDIIDEAMSVVYSTDFSKESIG
jgi:hypothetical protein